MPTVEQIQDELALYDQAMASSSCGITIADARLPDMPLIYANDAFERITGYAPHEVLGKNCRFLQAHERDQQAVQMIRNAIRNGQHCTALLRNYRKDGTFFWNELFMSPIFDEEGTLTHFVGIQTDVTEREQAKQQLQDTLSELRMTQTMLVHSEKMNALGQVVAGVAHEINNPIAFVNSNVHSLRGTFAELVEAYNDLEAFARAGAQPAALAGLDKLRQTADVDFLLDDTQDLIDQTLTGLRRVKTIVEELRKFSRLDEAEYKVANLRENVESTLLVASGELRARVAVTVDIDPTLEFRCAPAELNQVFLNIVINAAQAIDGEGQITISAREESNCVVIAFTDSGSGIPPEVIGHIFDPFFTTKPVGTGTGLGLAISHKIIVDGHKGTISADSTPGAGTTFTIRLPKELR